MTCAQQQTGIRIMWKPASTGVFLQRIETPESNRIILNIFRKPINETHVTATVMALHFNPNNPEDYTLHFDPWSDINVVPDGSIDEKDTNALTRLALDFRDQTEISSDFGVFLAAISVDDERLLVRIEVLDLEDNEQPVFYYFLDATSRDEGENFTIKRVNPHSGPTDEETPGLENLTKAFIKLKL